MFPRTLANQENELESRGGVPTQQRQGVGTVVSYLDVHQRWRKIPPCLDKSSAPDRCRGYGTDSSLVHPFGSLLSPDILQQDASGPKAPQAGREPVVGGKVQAEEGSGTAQKNQGPQPILLCLLRPALCATTRTAPIAFTLDVTLHLIGMVIMSGALPGKLGPRISPSVNRNSNPSDLGAKSWRGLPLTCACCPPSDCPPSALSLNRRISLAAFFVVFLSWLSPSRGWIASSCSTTSVSSERRSSRAEISTSYARASPG